MADDPGIDNKSVGSRSSKQPHRSTTSKGPQRNQKSSTAPLPLPTVQSIIGSILEDPLENLDVLSTVDALEESLNPFGVRSKKVAVKRKRVQFVGSEEDQEVEKLIRNEKTSSAAEVHHQTTHPEPVEPLLGVTDEEMLEGEDSLGPGSFDPEFEDLRSAGEPLPNFNNKREFVEGWLEMLRGVYNNVQQVLSPNRDQIERTAEAAGSEGCADPDQQEVQPFEDDEFGGFWANSEESFGAVEEAIENMLLERPEERLIGEEPIPNDEFIHPILLHSEASTERLDAEEQAWKDMERDSLAESDEEDPIQKGYDDLIDNFTNRRHDYTKPEIQATARELQALAFYGIAVKYGAQHAMIDDMREYIYDFYDRYTHTKKIPTLKTYRKILEKVTDLHPIYYDACKRSCICYGAKRYEELDHCPRCKTPRIDPRSGRPYSRFMVIPLEERLRLWFADKTFAKLLRTYPQYARLRANGKNESGRKYCDFWNGTNLADLEKDGYFKDDTELALCLATDGVEVFRTRCPFNVWPIIFSCFNLPPEIRYRRSSLLLGGCIPGPKQPSNLDSFLEPIVDELERLQKGIRVWDASRQKEITLRVHLTLASSDMVGRAKISKFMGELTFQTPCKRINSYFCCPLI